MNISIPCGERSGAVAAPPSKSALHRLFILAATGERECEIISPTLPEDAEATLRCLHELGADTERTCRGVKLRPISTGRGGTAVLRCGESGATLRFLLPLVGVMGREAVFVSEGRLPERPIEPLAAELRRHGMDVRREGARIFCSGTLRPGEWTMGGEISSQFVSALLMALPLLGGDSSLEITGRIESAGYIDMTERALRLAGICFERRGNTYLLPGRQCPALPSAVKVEGDWSGAAAFLAMGALSARGVCVSGLDADSAQGDRAIVGILRAMGAKVECAGDTVTVRMGALHGVNTDASQTPDLVPVLAALASLSDGRSVIYGAARLRLKESDRLSTAAEMLRTLGANVTEQSDGLLICGSPALRGGSVESFSDHRIAMAAAVAACGCERGVELRGADCVAKSYPLFWEDLSSLFVSGGES